MLIGSLSWWIFMRERYFYADVHDKIIAISCTSN